MDKNVPEELYNDKNRTILFKCTYMYSEGVLYDGIKKIDIPIIIF